MRRPVATTLLVLATGILGLLGYRALPVAALPAIDFPVIEVSAALPGATAETMSESVTTPLETSLANIPGLEGLTSVSTAGSTSIALRFDAGAVAFWSVLLLVLGLLSALASARRVLRIDPIEATTGGGNR